jgi:hypothetical protein
MVDDMAVINSVSNNLICQLADMTADFPTVVVEYCLVENHLLKRPKAIEDVRHPIELHLLEGNFLIDIIV